jgi:hypothetical protein
MPDEVVAFAGDIHGDPWHWLVVYADGKPLQEYDADTGQPRAFAAALAGVAEHGDIHTLVMAPQRVGLQSYVVLVPEGARPILFRRRALPVILNPDAPAPELPPRLTVVGWQQTIARRNYQSLLALYDDGSAILTSDRDAI